MKKSTDADGIALTVALFLTALVMIVLLAFTKSFMGHRTEEQGEPNATVIAFLDEYVPLRVLYEQEQVVEKYFPVANITTRDEIGRSEDLRNFNAVFSPNGEANGGYRILLSAKDYIELMLQDTEGNDVPCRIGFYYRISEGRITSYSIARLQPVMRTDPEWRATWI